MSAATSQDVSNVDLADPRLWDAGVPWDVFGALRREQPIHFSPQASAPGPRSRRASGRTRA